MDELPPYIKMTDESDDPPRIRLAYRASIVGSDRVFPYITSKDIINHFWEHPYTEIFVPKGSLVGNITSEIFDELDDQNEGDIHGIGKYIPYHLIVDEQDIGYNEELSILPKNDSTILIYPSKNLELVMQTFKYLNAPTKEN